MSVNSEKLRIEFNGVWREIDAPHLLVEEFAPGHYIVRDGDRSFEVFESDGKLSDGRVLDGVEIRIESNRERIIRERFGGLNGAEKGVNSGTHIVKAPMPGMVRAIKVRAGDVVERNSTLLVLEAMKMENNILAGTNGTIRRVYAEEGKSVDRNQSLMEIELK